MKKNKILFLKARASFLKNLIRLLSLTGFSFLVSCEKNPGPIAMYGIITSEFKFKGMVTDQVTHNPIPGINIKITPNNNDTTIVLTNLSGSYSAYRFDTYEDQNVKMIFTDTDSTVNGKYASKTVDVVLNFRDINNSELEEDVELTPIQ